MKYGNILLASLALVSMTSLPLDAETPGQKAERMEWFSRAKLGIFIHWGIYSKGETSESWAFHNGTISIEDYMKQREAFTAANYDPAYWARLIKESGARYTVITTKHHDGFALWDTKAGDDSAVKNSPAGRDVLAPFAEEVQAEDVAEGDAVFATVAVRSSKIVLSGVTGANIIRFDGDVALKVYVLRDKEAEVVADMFMLANEVEMERTQAQFRCFGKTAYTSEKIHGTASLGDRPEADAVVAVPYARCFVAKAETAESGATVEGVLNADVVYTDESGLNSVRAEVPFSLDIDGEFGDGVKAFCVVEKVAAKVRRGGEIEIDATVGILLTSYRTATVEYISSVTLGEEKEQNTSALSLYIASDGDEMWDVCKALTATPEEIMQQNPSLSTPLAEGERVIFFRSLS